MSFFEGSFALTFGSTGSTAPGHRLVQEAIFDDLEHSQIRVNPPRRKPSNLIADGLSPKRFGIALHVLGMHLGNSLEQVAEVL